MLFGRRKRSAAKDTSESDQDLSTEEATAEDSGTSDSTTEDVSAAADGTASESESESVSDEQTSSPSGDSDAATTADSTATADSGQAEDSEETFYDRAEHGPFDSDEVEIPDSHIDLGALLIAPSDGLQLRLEVEEKTQRVVAVTLDLEQSSLQVQAFAAPRSETLWSEIREQITDSVKSQGGRTSVVSGTFGPEIIAELPVQGEGAKGERVARFIGVDGPRWFLRGVFGGKAARDRDAAASLEQIFRAVVVVREDTPMPPRDLLPLRLPKEATAAGQKTEDELSDGSASDAGENSQRQGKRLQPPHRGPEITQVG